MYKQWIFLLIEVAVMGEMKQLDIKRYPPFINDCTNTTGRQFSLDMYSLPFQLDPNDQIKITINAKTNDYQNEAAKVICVSLRENSQRSADNPSFLVVMDLITDSVTIVHSDVNETAVPQKHYTGPGQKVLKITFELKDEKYIAHAENANGIKQVQQLKKLNELIIHGNYKHLESVEIINLDDIDNTDETNKQKAKITITSNPGRH